MTEAARLDKADELYRRIRFYDAQLRLLGQMNTRSLMMFGDDDALCAVPSEMRTEMRQMLINCYDGKIQLLKRQLDELEGGEKDD